MTDVARGRGVGASRPSLVVPATLVGGGVATLLCLGLRVLAGRTGVVLNQRLTDAIGWCFYAVPLALIVLYVVTWWRWRYRRAHLACGVLACLVATAVALVLPFDDASDVQTVVIDAPDGNSRLVVASVPGVILDPLWRVRVEGTGWLDGSSVLGCINGDWHEPVTVEWAGSAHIRGRLDEGDTTTGFEAMRTPRGRWHVVGLDSCQR